METVGAIFYTPDIDGVHYTLNEEESAHAVRVLRLKEGNTVTLADGRGGLYHAQIERIHPKHCSVAVLHHQEAYRRRQYRLHIGIAPTKNIDRFEWFVEKATEIGIDEITPLLCEHSERKQVNMERLHRIAIAAMKQSQKAYLPAISPITPFEQWVRATSDAQRYIAHCHAGNLPLLKTAYLPGMNVTIAIGPEGDFSRAEVQHALGWGYTEISLGASRLRTETAGIAACHSIYFMNAEASHAAPAPSPQSR